jgi:hypothetical protein
MFLGVVLYIIINRVFTPIHINMIRISLVKKDCTLVATKMVQLPILRGQILNSAGTCYDVDFTDRNGEAFSASCLVSIFNGVLWIDTDMYPK